MHSLYESSHSNLKDSSRIHPNFHLTFSEFIESFHGLSFISIKQVKRFLSLANEMLKIPQLYFTLVDKNHPLPPNFQPKEVLTLSSHQFRVNKLNMQLEQRAYKSLSRMIDNAKRENISLLIISAWRSFERQKELFQYYTEIYGEKETRKFCAVPGYSQHQLGTTLDFGNLSNSFSHTPEGIWLKNNAQFYGWSLSYPEGEEELTGYRAEDWHWRWIGVDAVAMQNEFFHHSQQKLLEFWHEYAGSLASVHEPNSLAVYPDDILSLRLP